MKFKDGSKVLFKEENLPMEIIAHSDKYAVAMRDLDKNEDRELLEFKVKTGVYSSVHEAFDALKNEPVYTFIDAEEGVRGPSDRLFNGFDYYSKRGCENAIKALESGEIFISKRHRVSLNITEIT